RGPSRRLLTFNRKSVDQLVRLVVVLPVAGGLREAIIFGWRFSPRRARCGPDFVQNVRLRLGLSNTYPRRCHGGRWCWRGGERLYRVGMPSLWQANAPAGDDYRRNALLRCIRSEQECHQYKTYNSKIGENWHCRAPP